MVDMAQFPWKKILKQAGMEPGNVDKVKLISLLEKGLKEWKPSKTGAVSTIVADTAFQDAAKKNVHAILSKAANVIDFNCLIGFYAAQTDPVTAPNEQNLLHIREQLNLFLSKNTDSFHKEGKGIAKIYRLKNPKGEETGVEVPEPKDPNAKGAASSSIPLGRFTRKAKDALTEAGLPANKTVHAQFAAWCEKHDNTKPGMDDLKKFAATRE